MITNAKYFACIIAIVATRALGPVPIFAQESGEKWKISFDEPEINHWFDLWPFVSVLGGVALASDSVGRDFFPLYDLWGPMLGVRAGLGLPSGFRLVLSAQSLPYTQDDDTYFSSAILTARAGVGYWVYSVYVGLQYGIGTGFRVFDDYRINAQTQEWSLSQELSLVVDWHVSQGFYTCEASINTFFGGLLCGYGWTF